MQGINFHPKPIFFFIDGDGPTEFEIWLLRHGISRDTYERLKAQRILTLRDLRHAKESDIQDLSLIRGDHIRLRVAIKSLQEGPRPDSVMDTVEATTEYLVAK